MSKDFLPEPPFVIGFAVDSNSKSPHPDFIKDLRDFLLYSVMFFVVPVELISTR